MAERNDKDLWDPAKEIDRTRAQLAAAQTVKDEAIRAAGGYVVDPERAQGCIDELGRIAQDVRLALVQARVLQFDPPGFDDVSRNVANNGAEMARRAVAYVTTWANQIDATRVALQRQLDAYRAVEQANSGGRA
ncbi:PE domain-containing protein [Pseudonocardia sp. GCM10023141]|uniref:PE domain-containing protein n=1 Tax=Pseudonocardia sp. GCM10023141 TaxID=3252653 RepID=UPI00360ED346